MRRLITFAKFYVDRMTASRRAARSGNIRLWDLASRQEIAQFKKASLLVKALIPLEAYSTGIWGACR